MCEDCQEIEEVCAESCPAFPEDWDRTVAYESAETLLSSGVGEEVVYKYCNKCGETKPISEFGLRKRSKDGHDYQCLLCARAYAEWRKSPEYEPVFLKKVKVPGMKQCVRCLKLKAVSAFYSRKDSKDGLSQYCIECFRERNQIWMANRKEKVKDIVVEETKICNICMKEKNISFFSRTLRNKDGYSNVCKSCSLEKNRKRSDSCNYEPNYFSVKQCSKCKVIKDAVDFSRLKSSRDGLASWCKQCNREKDELYLETHPEVRLRKNLRHRLSNFMTYGDMSGGEAAVAFLGCTVGELLKYLESMFYTDPKTGKEMSWKNYGKPRVGWDVDHIIPLSRVDLMDEEQLKMVCHFENLRPLWKHENSKKGNKLPSELAA